jgi:hypothetical protein
MLVMDVEVRPVGLGDVDGVGVKPRRRVTMLTATRIVRKAALDR